MLASSVQAGSQPNPLAASLGLLSEEAVAAFVAAGLPGLDLILLSARYVSDVHFEGTAHNPLAFHLLGSWLESLASLVVGFHWTLLDGVDLYSTAEPDRMPVVLAQNGSVLDVPAPEVRRPMAIRVGVESIVTPPPPFLHDSYRSSARSWRRASTNSRGGTRCCMRLLSRGMHFPDNANGALKSPVVFVFTRFNERRQRRSSDHTEKIINSLGDFGDQLVPACGEHPQHPACIYWRLTHIDMHKITAPSRHTAPALDLNGQPAFIYLQRAAQRRGLL